ncbi:MULTISPECIES: sensor histidine kinase [Mesorhizobium]|uniref:histidine kinase n=1 Tax=Mesorhizobium denitrificans TaxID=2294114 RepID=A0A371XHM9_9HYPH|nr:MULTISPECIES: HAMP domain-containing sensor histidine kinase [Mesorhizobium]RFC68740.1 sensor histidine kinase [Mesorhizobium denitrificans]
MAWRIPAALKTTAFRLSALYLLLFAACAVMLVLYMTAMSARLLNDQTQEAITAEASDLGRAYSRGGLPLLVRMVASRSRQPGANLYLIADSQGRILSGNVESLEPGVFDVDGWTQRPFSYKRFGEGSPQVEGEREGTLTEVDRNSDGHKALALVLRLPNQMILLVGRDLGEPERFRSAIRQALVISLGTMAFGGLLIWFFVGRRALKRIDSVSAASKRIMGGDLTGRLPVSGAGDEFDRLSENLNVMLSRIGELNDGLKEVSDNIAHDLKTPLTRLRNRAEAALTGKPKAAEYRQALEATISESDQLIRTFNAILMISRLEAGYSAEQVEPVDLAEAVADVAELYDPVAEEAGVALTSRVQSGCSIKGNRELVAQALSNIVDNAIKYSAGSSEAPKVEISLAQEKGDCVIRVRDNGPGIAEEADRHRVTERFVRLEKSRSQPGSGLGLSLAKAVMKFHGGKLDVLSANPGLLVVMTFHGQRDSE